MSIIYDALQKTQQRGHGLNKPIPLKSGLKLQWQKMSFILFGLMVLLILGVILQMTWQFYSKSPIPASSVVKKTTHTHKLNLQLNGIFLDSNDKLAMINNNMYSLGDSIDGLKIVSITTNRVRLQDNEHSILLRLD